MIEESTNNTNRPLQRWITEVLNLPKGTVITITERECRGKQHSSIDTAITIRFGKNHSHKYTIPKSLADITYEDIKLLQTTVKAHIFKKHTIFSHLFRFFGCWLAFSGLYAMFAVCPFCGRVGCPVGAGSAGLVGGFFALCMQNWKVFGRFIHSKLFRRS